MIRIPLSLLAILTLSLAPQAALSQEAGEAIPADAGQVVLSPAELFQFADNARDAGDFVTAEAAYRALAGNPDPALRAEARFRLALMLADQMERPRDAAVLLREILDEQPDVARVRVELARMQAMLGNFESARRELRAAQAAGLPPEVDQMVRFYANALSARKPFGGSFQAALAPDSNINRATQSDTLETVIGDFDLSDDAQATSGVGLALRGQGYYRLGLGRSSDLLLRVNGAARFYGRDEFNDYIGSVQLGPQFTWGGERFSVAALASHRWFGNDPYNTAYGLSANWQHPINQTTRATVDATAIRSDDKASDLRDSNRYSLALGLDRAFSARFGGGISLSGFREVARDPGYSLASGGINLYLFRELGQTTLVANAGYDHLEADARLSLYPRRRIDDRFELGLTGTFRALRVGSFAPLASFRFEHNSSTVGIYDYRRLALELGVTAAF
jgi:outer membrane protein